MEWNYPKIVEEAHFSFWDCSDLHLIKVKCFWKTVKYET
jgi:hypothetical protein